MRGRSLAARFARPSPSFGFCAVACRACLMQYCCRDWLEWHAWTGFISFLRVSKPSGARWFSNSVSMLLALAPSSVSPHLRRRSLRVEEARAQSFGERIRVVTNRCKIEFVRRPNRSASGSAATSCSAGGRPPFGRDGRRGVNLDDLPGLPGPESCRPSARPLPLAAGGPRGFPAQCRNRLDGPLAHEMREDAPDSPKCVEPNHCLAPASMDV